jgi:hypothetical protein
VEPEATLSTDRRVLKPYSAPGKLLNEQSAPCKFRFSVLGLGARLVAERAARSGRQWLWLLVIAVIIIRIFFPIIIFFVIQQLKRKP